MSDRLLSLIDELRKDRDQLWDEAARLNEAIETLEQMHAERDVRANRSAERRERVKEWLK